MTASRPAALKQCDELHSQMSRLFAGGDPRNATEAALHWRLVVTKARALRRVAIIELTPTTSLEFESKIRSYFRSISYTDTCWPERASRSTRLCRMVPVRGLAMETKSKAKDPGRNYLVNTEGVPERRLQGAFRRQ